MLGPESLRLQQTAPKKTYGNRGKRAATVDHHSPAIPTNTNTNTISPTSTSIPASSTITSSHRQFNWSQLDHERKARIEQPHARHSQKLQLRRRQGHAYSSSFSSELEGASADIAATRAEMLLSSDVKLSENDCKEAHTRSISTIYKEVGTTSSVETVFSTQDSDPELPDHTSQTKLSYAKAAVSGSAGKSSAEQRIIRTVGSTQESDSEAGSQLRGRLGGGGTIRSAIGQLGPRQLQDTVSQRKPLSHPPLPYIQHSAMSAHRKVMFQEKAFCEEEEDQHEEIGGDDNGNEGDEVLFRTPSFHILQKLKELPKLKVPEPRVNPFGFDSLQASAGRKEFMSGGDTGELKDVSISSSVLGDTTFSTPMRNPFLESPTTKKSMDILNRRAKQLKDLEDQRKLSDRQRSVSKSEDTSMEIERDDERDMLSTSSRHKVGSSPDLFSVTASSQSTRPSTPEQQRGSDKSTQDDCVDLALGKRMSSIEITPRRLLAKQRKTLSSNGSPMPAIPAPPSFLNLTGSDKMMDDDHPRPLRLLVDRDIPESEQDELDNLFKHNLRPIQATRTASSASSSSNSSQSSLLHPTVPRSLKTEPRSSTLSSASSLNGHRSSLAPPHRSQLLKFDRLPPRKNKLHLNDGSVELLRDPFLNLQNPFQEILDPNGQDQLPHLRFTVNERQTSPSKMFRQASSTPGIKPAAQAAPSNGHCTHEPQLQQHRGSRKVRSLKRPPAALVSSRRSVFRPTVDDLLSICDQRFFAQFDDIQPEWSCQTPTPTSTVCRNNDQAIRNILDFESLLPESMSGTLSKIGEASYSEVYTVDLPITKFKNKRVAMQASRHFSHNDHSHNNFGLFQSPKLNAYIKESAEDDLLSMRNTTSTPKLVMKVMPFYDDQANCASGLAVEGQTISSRGRRTKERPKVESTLLALEDIYREAMVSTQIMHGWKGFIGSFGAMVVKGKYPKAFLSVWDQFRKEQGTESERPDIYAKDQLYCIILLPYGGIDLEHCPLANWQQAWSVLTQVAASLESKEQAPFWFEHRDLHWGNILVKGTQQAQVVFPKRDHHGHRHDQERSEINTSRSITTFGIIVQMIDFTLARVQGDRGNLIYMDLEKDQDLFRGQGDYQFEIYRKMQKAISKNWAASCPQTNLFWLHYIADKLLTKKNLKRPKLRVASTASSTLYHSRTSTTMKQSLTNSISIDNRSDRIEMWCYERVVAVSKMNLDQLDLSGHTPTQTVLDLLLLNQPL
ncbi:hypothetical protein EDD11_009803 [Mortierella claussenii]|nr:hypothetical protein EDD11_009803 [Mortierella claussenii]